jgi:proline racemase
MLSLSAQYSVIDTHTAGHPTRVIVSGIPPLRGDSVLALREDFRARFDYLRGSLLHEPRGHAAMVGLVLVPSKVADYGAFFISSYVYLDMCGHGTIGLTKALAANGQLQAGRDKSFTLETPAGVVTVNLLWNADGTFAAARMVNVPSVAHDKPVVVEHPTLGRVSVELVYSGMWYALVDAAPLDLPLTVDNVSSALRLGAELKKLIAQQTDGTPGFESRPAASVLFFEDEAAEGFAAAARHMLILDINKFDRSPCGTGTSARLATLVRQGKVKMGQAYRAANLLGNAFVARPVVIDEQTGSVTAEVEGTAYLSAFSTLVVERGDPLTGGFLPR